MSHFCLMRSFQSVEYDFPGPQLQHVDSGSMVVKISSWHHYLATFVMCKPLFYADFLLVDYI